MITADKVFKGSTPISKIYLGLNLVWEMAAPIPGADAYVQKGLVFQLDGIEKGDDPTAWTDLKGGIAFTYNNCTLNSDNVEFNGKNSYAEYPLTVTNFSTYSESTVEYCYYSEGGSIFSIGPAENNSRYYNHALIDVLNNTNTYWIRRNMRYILQPLQGLTNSLSVRYNEDDYSAVYNNGNMIPDIGTSTWNGNYKYNYGKSVVGCHYSDYSYRRGYLKGKIHSIRLYNRSLTQEERFHNLLIDYKRFNMPCDKITINLINDKGEPITNALIKINNYTFTLTESTATYCVPKGKVNFIWFNGVPYHRAPEPFIGISGTQTINAVYTYTGFEDGLMLEVTSTTSNYYVSLPFTEYLEPTIDWGDGTINSSINHTYVNPGTYIIKCSGTFGSWALIGTIKDGVKKILQFPSVPFTYMFYFLGLEYIAPVIVTSGSPYIEMGYDYTGTLSDGRNGVKGVSATPLVKNRYILTSKVDFLALFTAIQDLEVGNLFCSGTLIDNPHYISKIEYYLPEYGLVTGTNKTSTVTYFDLKNFSNLKYLVLDKSYFTTWSGRNLVYNFNSYFYYWGTGSEEARQSLVKTLIENTPDMTLVPGTHNRTILLSAGSKAVLTEDEIAQITAKGYTIA